MKSRPVVWAAMLLGALLAGAVGRGEAGAAAFRYWRGVSAAENQWSNPANWDGGTVIANGDYVTFGGNSLGGRLTNDILNLSLARIEFEYSSDGYTLEGNGVVVTSIVTAGAGKNSIELNLGGPADMLVAVGAELHLSGTNTFAGPVNIYGDLYAESGGALGNTAGGTRVNPGGELYVQGVDLGQELVQISGLDPLTSCGLRSDGASTVRDLQVGGTVCFLSAGSLSIPNGIGQYYAPSDVLLIGGVFTIGGNSGIGGPLRVTGATELAWNSIGLVDIIFQDFEGPLVATGDLRGTGTASTVDFHGGSFAPGSGNTPGRFVVGGLLKMRNGTYLARLNSTEAATGYSQATVGSVSIGAGTALELSIGFTPAAGMQFRIIDNAGSQAVSGTFAGLEEGATFSRGGLTWTITYKGGTGNDVVVTRAAEAPTDPRPFKRRLPMLARG